MKLQFFGREAEVKTEAVVAAVSALALIGMLTGYLLLGDNGEIIIEASDGVTEQANSTDSRSAQGGDTAVSGIVFGNKGNISKDTHVSSGNGGGSGMGNYIGTGDVSGNDTGAGDNTGADGGSGNGTGTGNGYGSGNEESGNDIDNSGTDKIKVYVVGCVRSPGIITIEKGALICDAVEKAGGLTEEADADNINMVYSLNENVMLYIKSKQDSSSIGNGAVVYGDSGPAAKVTGGGNNAAVGDGRKALVNINTASIDELDTLPGIGEATARDIVAYREKYGGFSSIEDIMKVPRIKKNRFESIKDFITVG
jgi:competence protein ComEA